MRRLVLIAALGALAACGKVKNIDPLNGLAGPEDNTRYGFESSAQGWTVAAGSPNSCQSIFQNPGQSFFGQGSLALRLVGLDTTHGAMASIVYSAPLPSFVGKTIRLWVYAPQDIAPSDDKPSYVSIYLKDAAFVYGAGKGSNFARGNWTEVVYSPALNSGGLINDPSIGYINAGFNPAAVTELGVNIGVAGTASGFSFTGTILVDAVDWQ